MNKIASCLTDVKTVGIAGHVNPDGDCVGSALAIYLYLKKYYPDIRADLYLESVRPEFDFLHDIKEHMEICQTAIKYDLFIVVDVSTRDRIGVAGEAFSHAEKTICIDHHVSNLGYADENHVVPDACSASEVVYDLMDEEKITKEIAEALYLGIVHDSGVFQYSSTSSHTMQIAGRLMDKGIDFTRIVEETFYQKTYLQQLILGRVLSDSIRILDGMCIISVLAQETMDQYGVKKQDLDGIVSQLRLTKDVEVAVFLYEIGTQEYKVSLRSKSYVDVNKIANAFGGGGHIRAAGCSMNGSPYDVINNLTRYIEKELKERHD